MTFKIRPKLILSALADDITARQLGNKPGIALPGPRALPDRAAMSRDQVFTGSGRIRNEGEGPTRGRDSGRAR